MSTAPAILMWAVVSKHAQSEGVAHYTIRRTRKEAWSAYEQQLGTEYATLMRESGYVRFARVTVAEVSP